MYRVTMTNVAEPPGHRSWYMYTCIGGICIHKGRTGKNIWYKMIDFNKSCPSLFSLSFSQGGHYSRGRRWWYFNDPENGQWSSLAMTSAANTCCPFCDVSINWRLTKRGRTHLGPHIWSALILVHLLKLCAGHNERLVAGNQLLHHLPDHEHMRIKGREKKRNSVQETGKGQSRIGERERERERKQPNKFTCILSVSARE